MPGTSPSSFEYAPSQGPYANVQGQRLIAGLGGVSIGGGLQPVGGDTNIELMRGIAGLVRSNEAMAQELKGTAQQLRMLNERTMRTMGSAVGTQTRQAQDTVTVTKGELAAAIQAGVIAVTNQASAALNLPYSIPTDPGGGVYPDGPTPPSAGPALPPGGIMAPPPHHGGGAPEGSTQDPWNFGDARRGGAQYNIGHLRQGMAENARRRLSEAQWGEQLSVDPAGTFWRPNGTVATPSQVAQHERRQRILGAAKGVAGRVAEGGSLGEGISTAMPGMARIAGRLAGGIGIATQVGNFAEGQRSQNAEWQAIMGGSNAEGFVERARSRRFALSQFGTMGSDQAQELYMGVARTGLRGASRERATDFAVDAYKNLGMTIQESVQLIDMAARNGATSFGFLAQSLNQVTKSARAAGVSAVEARAQFTQNLVGTTQTVGLNAAAGIATAQTQAGMAYGREIGSNLSFAPQNTDSRQVLLRAAMSGQSANQYLANLQDPTTRGRQLGRNDAGMKQQAGQFLGNLGRQMVAQALAANGGRGLTAQGYKELARDYMRNGGTFQATQLPMVERLMGVSGLTMATVIPFLMQTYAGSTTGPNGQEVSNQSGDQYAQNQADTAGFNVSGDHLQGAERSRALEQIGMSGGDLGLIPGASGAPLNQLLARTTGFMANDQDKQRRAARIYWDQANKTGRAGGISAALVKNFEGGRRIRVQTKDGPRDVTTDDALRYYRDQVDRGEAMVVGGADNGKSVAEAMNMDVDEKVQVTSATNQKIGKHGKAPGEGGDGGKGTVQITMSPELKRWFSVNGTGIASTNPSANLAPPGARTTPGGLASDSARG